MKVAKKTTISGKPRHYHVAYLNDEDGVGVLGLDNKGRTHNIVYDPPRPPREPTPEVPPQIDPMTGMPAINPETGQPDMGTPADPGDPGKEEGTWIIEPDPMDGHTHEIAEYEIKVKKKTEEDGDIIKDCLGLWKAWRANTEESRKNGRESEDMVRGKQWAVEDKRSLESLSRAALTINEIGKNMDSLCGYQMKERTDITYLPQEGGDQKTADILNVVVKNILTNCYFPREESKVFRDMATTGMGVFNAYLDYNTDIQGEIKVEKFPWDNIDYGPHEKEDLSDCEGEIKSKMVSKATLKRMFRKKADEIEQGFKDYTFLKENPQVAVGGGTNTDYRYAKELPVTVDGTLPLIDIEKKEFRLVECWRKMYEPVSVIVNEEEKFFFNAYGWEDKDITAFEAIPGFAVITQMKVRMRITKFCGNTVLSDENPADLPVQDFFTVPAYAYRQGNYFWGKVECAKDPQKEINKRRSQVIDILNRMSAYLWFYDSETFKDNKEYQRFKAESSRPGGMFQLNNVNNRPFKEEGSEFPSALVQMMTMDQENLSRLMNIIVPPGGANESGSLYLEKKNALLTGNEFLFDNFSFAKQCLGRKLPYMIQRNYDTDRIMRILEVSNSRTPFEIGKKKYSEYQEWEIREMLDNADLTKVDVIVSESSFSPSTRLGVAKVLFELLKNGAQFDPNLPLQFVDMPDTIRAQVTENIQASSEAATQQAQNTSNTEIVKTLIAKGQYTVTPEKATELGLVPVPVGQQNLGVSETENPGNTQNIQDDLYAEKLMNQFEGGLAG